MNNYDINDYLPSILNPRGIRKQHGDLTLTQVSSNTLDICFLL